MKFVKWSWVLLIFTVSCGDPPPKTTREVNPEWVGRELPPFELTDLAGDTITAAALRGQVVMLNFWFTTCPPCLLEIPRLNQMARLFAGQDIAFLAFSPDDPATIRDFLEKHDFDFRIIPDAKTYIEQFGREYPKNFFVDRAGKMRYTRGGIPIQITNQHPGGELDDREFYGILTELLKKDD